MKFPRVCNLILHTDIFVYQSYMAVSLLERYRSLEYFLRNILKRPEISLHGLVLFVGPKISLALLLN